MGYAAQNIRVNAIAPAATLSEMLEKWLTTDEAKRAMAAQTPLNFIALPDDMARVALFLLSDESRWITGTVLPVDGGARPPEPGAPVAAAAPLPRRTVRRPVPGAGPGAV
ncbi:SDR family oxidoreductase [Streptomyces inhibens]|nr:SDR family oxidoreductase [Streptomyces inhibens]